MKLEVARQWPSLPGGETPYKNMNDLNVVNPHLCSGEKNHLISLPAGRLTELRPEGDKLNDFVSGGKMLLVTF